MPSDRHQSRAWKLMEALDAAPFGNEARLEIIQGFLDEERSEGRATSEMYPLSVPALGCGWPPKCGWPETPCQCGGRI